MWVRNAQRGLAPEISAVTDLVTDGTVIEAAESVVPLV